ncbi:hypothetical protein Bca4012_031819 [Brassica carinata]|uniref:Uncharacterized protein n=4 Tax=Brassica TaxID=3705 RepID=A0A0D2ZS86_BRAOL|nr:hypothetical protein Bca52824_046475 [Brassica carinata]VDD10165.1 unnamed protein product [Brassica oleracea]
MWTYSVNKRLHASSWSNHQDHINRSQPVHSLLSARQHRQHRVAHAFPCPNLRRFRPGSERNFLSRLVFFFGIHEVMLVWCRVIVRPVVDSTMMGGEACHHRREETVVERVALAVSCGKLWWWNFDRDEVEALVGVAEAKRALLLLLPISGNNVNVGLEVGMVDFVNGWLYYIVVTIGMVRIVKGSLWFGL